jgi:hypothetical protein
MDTQGAHSHDTLEIVRDRYGPGATPMISEL